LLQSFFEEKGFNYFTSLDLFDDIVLSKNTNLLMVAGKGISLDNLKLNLDELGEHRLKFMQVSTKDGLKLGVYHSMNYNNNVNGVNKNLFHIGYGWLWENLAGKSQYILVGDFNAILFDAKAKENPFVYEIKDKYYNFSENINKVLSRYPSFTYKAKKFLGAFGNMPRNFYYIKPESGLEQVSLDGKFKTLIDHAFVTEDLLKNKPMVTYGEKSASDHKPLILTFGHQ
jgi:hypothetical protein